MSTSIAKQVFDYNVKLQESGELNSQIPVMPEGVVGKMMTCQAHGRPYQNGIIFSDGSELTVSFRGGFFWTEAGAWKPESPENFKVQVNMAEVV